MTFDQWNLNATIMYFSQYLVFYLFQDLVFSVKNDQHKITFCLEYNMLCFEKLYSFPCRIATCKADAIMKLRKFIFKEIFDVHPYGFKNTHEILFSKFHVLMLIEQFQTFPASKYMFKVNNRNTRRRREICSKLIIKTPEQCH